MARPSRSTRPDSRLCALPNRADREKVMSGFSNIGSYGGTFGSTMNGEVQKVMPYANARKYERRRSLAQRRQHSGDRLHAAGRWREQGAADVPSLSQLRQRMMAWTSCTTTTSTPLVGSVNLEYTPEQAEKLVLDAVAPLGADYTSVVKKAFDNRWIDHADAGQRSGAYSNGGAYDVHPTC
jgi:oligoendopeptidase F